MKSEEVKEVFMDVQAGGSESFTTTRKRRAGGRRRTQKQEGGAAVEEQSGPVTDVVVDKEAGPAPTGVPELKPTVAAILQGPQKGGAPAKLILAPAKKKPAKLMLVPKHKSAKPRRVFTAKRVRVTIDNTAKTVKRRRQILQSVDAMTEEQLRNAAVEAHLTRREKVDKVPASLLRQMLKDYRTMKGMLL